DAGPPAVRSGPTAARPAAKPALTSVSCRSHSLSASGGGSSHPGSGPSHVSATRPGYDGGPTHPRPSTGTGLRRPPPARSAAEAVEDVAPHDVQVEAEPEPRPGGQPQAATGVVERLLQHLVVGRQLVPAGLDAVEVRRRDHDVAARDEVDRPRGVVRAHRQVVGLGHRRDLLQLADPAGPGDVRHDVVGEAPLEDLDEGPPGVEALPWRGCSREPRRRSASRTSSSPRGCGRSTSRSASARTPRCSPRPRSSPRWGTGPTSASRTSPRGTTPSPSSSSSWTPPAGHAGRPSATT